MSWSRRRALSAGTLIGSLFAAVMLGGCGFKPLYGSNAGDPDAAAKLAQVDINTIPNRQGQILRNRLIDRFYIAGYPSQTVYRLDISVESRTDKLSLKNDASTERGSLTSTANFHLIEKATNKVVAQGTSQAQIGYTVLEEQYGGVATVNELRERSLEQIADDITLRVATALGRGS